jgi:hypothetical protein
MKINTWGLYPWFREWGLDLIHPDDLATVEAHSPYGVVCEIIGSDGPFLVIRSSSHQFRGKPVLFQPVPPPAFHVRQRVKTQAPRTPRIGFIRVIGWHYKRNEPYYLLEVNGKASSRRYRAEELEAG